MPAGEDRDVSEDNGARIASKHKIRPQNAPKMTTQHLWFSAKAASQVSLVPRGVRAFPMRRRRRRWRQCLLIRGRPVRERQRLCEGVEDTKAKGGGEAENCVLCQAHLLDVVWRAGAAHSDSAPPCCCCAAHPARTARGTGSSACFADAQSPPHWRTLLLD